MISLKGGVRILGLRPELLFAIERAGEVWAEEGLDLTVTSVMEGKHGSGRLPYVGPAFDARISDIPPEKRAGLKAALALVLGPDFDVVLEADHMHIEFQPKAAYSWG